MTQNIIRYVLLIGLIALLASCDGSAADVVSNATVAQVATSDNALAADTSAEATAAATTVVPTTDPIAVAYDAADLNASDDPAASTSIRFDGTAIAVDGAGATVDGAIVTITAGGSYTLSGTLEDGQVVVDTADEEPVVLILNGVDLTSTTSAAILVRNAEKTVITLADGSENRVTDAEVYVVEGDEADAPNAAIFSRDDLTINGSGALTVNGRYNHGIAGKDDVRITGGTITITAVNDGIKGRDSIAILDGAITIDAGGDGLQSTNEEEADKGFILIEGGALSITSGGDAIQAATRLAISGGEFDIVTGGGSAQGGSVVASAKGLKAAVDVTITGGIFAIDAADDAVHANQSVTIAGGEFQIATGDDAIHADETVLIRDGVIDITTAYEGIEAASITIDGGTIRMITSDDGINAASGDGTDGPPMPGAFVAGDNQLTINGGYLAVDALGDGLDVNGSITMTGGVVLVNGPTVNMEGPLDYDGTFVLTGGYLVAAGSAGMAQAPGDASTENTVLIVLDAVQAAGTPVHIATVDGEAILTFVPTKSYQSLVLASPELQSGETYVVFTGGSTTGTVSDSLVVDGVYTEGTEMASFTVSGTVTTVGAAVRAVPGGPGGARPGRP